MSDNKPEKEEKEDNRKDGEELDNKKGESLALELDDSMQDEESNFSPASPVYEMNSWREEPNTPKYIPESPLPDDFEPEPEIEEVLSDDEEPEDPSAEIIQIEDLDDATVSQHRNCLLYTSDAADE